MYERAENIERVRKSIADAIAGRKFDFSKENWNLMAIFDDPITKYSPGRVLLFQGYFTEQIGIIPEIISQRPACLKVFFRIDTAEEGVQERIFEIISSNEFEILCNDLNISTIQYGSKLMMLSKKTAS